MCNRHSEGLLFWRKILSLCLSALLIVSPFAHQTALAQSGSETDFEIPVLTIEKDPTGVKGEDQQFIVRVTDNNAVGSVKLFYRFSANDNYTEADLTRLENDDELFVATITQDELSSDSIQYYISASDTAGNTVQRGYSFSPLTVNLQQTIASDGNTAVTTAPKSSNRTLYTILGVLAAGAAIGLAASAGGGSGGGGGGGDPAGCGSSGCVLTLTAPRPGR